MCGFDWFDTDVKVCGKVKDPDEKSPPEKRKTGLFKNQTRKGRPHGKKRESESFYRAKVPLAANPTK
jgi:hypothetical protein